MTGTTSFARVPARRFGRRAMALRFDEPAGDVLPSWVDDLRLFAMTFAGGFLFVTIYFA